MIEVDKAVEFIRNLNDFNSQESEDYNWSSESEEWWDNFKRVHLKLIEFDLQGKVLTVMENNGIGYIQMRWLRTLASIVNEGLKRDLKEGNVDVESLDKVDVDGIEYAQITMMTYFVLVPNAQEYLMKQYSA